MDDSPYNPPDTGHLSEGKQPRLGALWLIYVVAVAFTVPGLLLAVMSARVLWMCYANGPQLPQGVLLTFGINAFFVIAGAALLLKHRSAPVLITLGASVFVVRTLLGSSGTPDYWSMASYAIAVGVAWWARGSGLLRPGSNNSPKPTPLHGEI